MYSWRYSPIFDSCVKENSDGICEVGNALSAAGNATNIECSVHELQWADCFGGRVVGGKRMQKQAKWLSTWVRFDMDGHNGVGVDVGLLAMSLDTSNILSCRLSGIVVWTEFGINIVLVLAAAQQYDFPG